MLLRKIIKSGLFLLIIEKFLFEKEYKNKVLYSYSLFLYIGILLLMIIKENVIKKKNLFQKIYIIAAKIFFLIFFWFSICGNIFIIYFYFDKKLNLTIIDISISFGSLFYSLTIFIIIIKKLINKQRRRIVLFRNRQRFFNMLRRKRDKLIYGKFYNKILLVDKTLKYIYQKKILDKEKIKNFCDKNYNILDISRSIKKIEENYILDNMIFSNFEKNDICIICYSNFDENDLIINFNEFSKTLYHFNCLKSWFNTKFRCPLSKKNGCIILLRHIINN